MSPEDANTTLFGDTLACEEQLRAAFSAHLLTPGLVESLCARADIHLSAIAVIEDSRNEEEDSSQGLAMRRMEAKLDLLLTLVGGLYQSSQSDPHVVLRWSALGASLDDQAPQAEGITGLFRVQAAPWLPEPLELPATVIASQSSGDKARLWLRFEPLTTNTASALERHLFRQHRRAIAERRRNA